MAGAATLTFDGIAAAVPSTLSSYEKDIAALTNGNNGALSSADLFKLQQLVTQWSLASTTFTTVLKSLGDTLRGALQKIN